MGDSAPRPGCCSSRSCGDEAEEEEVEEDDDDVCVIYREETFSGFTGFLTLLPSDKRD
jgi:hypothetical protein